MCEVEGKGGIEGGPVDAAIMTFKDILDGREIDEGIKRARGRVRGALSQTGNVPDAHSLVLRRGYDKIVLGMELRRHHIVRVASKDRYAVARGAVPDADGLVVGTRELDRICC